MQGNLSRSVGSGGDGGGGRGGGGGGGSRGVRGERGREKERKSVFTQNRTKWRGTCRRRNLCSNILSRVCCFLGKHTNMIRSSHQKVTTKKKKRKINRCTKKVNK